MTKKSKASVDYEPKAKMREHRCGNCAHYQGGGVCELVAGKVNTGGWCKLWRREAGK